MDEKNKSHTNTNYFTKGKYFFFLSPCFCLFVYPTENAAVLFTAQTHVPARADAEAAVHAAGHTKSSGPRLEQTLQAATEMVSERWR